MNSKVFMVVRILLGQFLLVFGLNKFLQFMPYGEMSEGGMAYMGALASTNTIPYLVGIVEVVAGLSFIFNKFGALMAIISVVIVLCSLCTCLTTLVLEEVR